MEPGGFGFAVVLVLLVNPSSLRFVNLVVPLRTLVRSTAMRVVACNERDTLE